MSWCQAWGEVAKKGLMCGTCSHVLDFCLIHPILESTWSPSISSLPTFHAQSIRALTTYSQPRVICNYIPTRQQPPARLSAFYLEFNVDSLQNNRFLSRWSQSSHISFPLSGRSKAITPSARRVMSRISLPSALIPFASHCLSTEE